MKVWVVVEWKRSPAPPVPKRRRSLPPARFRRGRIGAPLASQETLASSFCSDLDCFDDLSSSCHADLEEDDFESHRSTPSPTPPPPRDV